MKRKKDYIDCNMMIWYKNFMFVITFREEERIIHQKRNDDFFNKHKRENHTISDTDAGDIKEFSSTQIM